MDPCEHCDGAGVIVYAGDPRSHPCRDCAGTGWAGAEHVDPAPCCPAPLDHGLVCTFPGYAANH